MRCPACRSTAVRHRSERTAQGYRRFRCGNCGKQFNERSAGLLNRAQYPSDVIAVVVLWRLRYKLSLRDLAEMFLIRGLVFSYEVVHPDAGKTTLTEKLLLFGGAIQLAGSEGARRAAAGALGLDGGRARARYLGLIGGDELRA